ncbi:MAG: hypothetical protein NTX50_23100 [Candidatus Sumerlaeota bacterium]|nr:hypothetical protein [Candidatus Sumerlaeota bacterium]
MNDLLILRDLAKQYTEICAAPEQQTRRGLWRRHNSLKPTRPLIYARAFAWAEMPDSRCQCEDAFFRHCENFFRYHLFWNSLNDDSIFEPWVTVAAEHRCQGWGVEIHRRRSNAPGGSFKVDYPVKQLDDATRLRLPYHEIDEERTAEKAKRLQDAIGGIITINVDRGPAYRMWTGDISSDLGYLRGIENIMTDMMENPEWLHRLVKFMSDGILHTHEQAEAAGDWSLCAHQNQAMAYAEELQDPAANVNGVKRRQLWGYMAAQEFTAVSPAMHEEFLLQYQLPILKEFGLAAYGCCENLTHKISMLRQIPNLRRIAVSPFADVAECAHQIGQDYVVSYRPSPADMVGYGFNPDRIRKILRRDLTACRDCHVDITLKDVETVQSDPARARRWVALTREVIDEIWN